MKVRISLVLAVTTILASPISASAREQTVGPDDAQINRWHAFMDQVYALHEKQIAGRELRTEERLGGYRDNPEFYREVRYYDRANGQLLSTIQWEQQDPKRVHAIWVQIYGDNDRVVRDYSGWYLPHTRNAPRGTWITFHAYNGELHGFRQFDASDNRIYDACEGSFQGKKVDIGLDDLDIARALREPEGILSTAAYRECFRGLPTQSAGVYLKPH